MVSPHMQHFAEEAVQLVVERWPMGLAVFGFAALPGGKGPTNAVVGRLVDWAEFGRLEWRYLQPFRSVRRSG
jgi:hypothetical protein